MTDIFDTYLLSGTWQQDGSSRAGPDRGQDVPVQSEGREQGRARQTFRRVRQPAR